jgi:hypothetical protein
LIADPPTLPSVSAARRPQLGPGLVQVGLAVALDVLGGLQQVHLPSANRSQKHALGRR